MSTRTSEVHGSLFISSRIHVLRSRWSSVVLRPPRPTLASKRLLRDSPVFMCFFWAWPTGPLLDGVLGTDCFSNLKVSYYFCSLYSTQFFFLQGPETAVFLRLFGLWLNQRCSLRMHTLTASGRNSYSPYCRFWDILFLFLRHQRLGGLHYCYGVMFYQETVL